MKQVWVLEVFVTNESMRESLNTFKEYRDNAIAQGDDKYLSEINSVIARQERKLVEFPEGCWTGIEGKTIYKQFCNVAKDAIRYNRKGNYRVVRAEIEDTASVWIGYVNPVVNEGVLKYLYATC